MRKFIPMMGLVVVAIACSETAGEMLTDAGQVMMDAGDAMAPDADAQVGDCPCETGPQGDPGPNGDPGPQGSPGIVAATSFLGPTHSFLSNLDAWTCEFGTQAGERLDVAAGQRVLITGQGSADPQNTADIPFEFCVAWRQTGDSGNGTLGHSVENSTVAVMTMSTHVTELTPALAAGTYEFGVCARSILSPRIFAARYMYGTAVVIN